LKKFLTLSNPKIKSNISKREKDFKALPVQDPEFQVSERIDEINRETENCLLVNPSESILGLSAVRIGTMGKTISAQVIRDEGQIIPTHLIGPFIRIHTRRRVVVFINGDKIVHPCSCACQ